jgi:hypothetical protein
LGVLLLKNNTCCFCCQKLLILSKAENNWHYNWKLSSETKFRLKFWRIFLSTRFSFVVPIVFSFG